MINKTFPSLIDLNIENQHVTVYIVNPEELNPISVSECKNQTITFFKISISGYENIETKIGNALIREFDVNNMICRSNYILNLIFCIMQNYGYSNSNFNKILKKVEFHKYRDSRMMLEII